MKTQLYKCYGKGGVLLYVGISNSPENRMKQHSNNASWYSDVVNVEYEEFETRESALRAESDCISGDSPIHNRKRPNPREGKTQIAGFFDPSIGKKLKFIALEEGTTVQALLGEALELLFSDRNGVRSGTPSPISWEPCGS